MFVTGDRQSHACCWLLAVAESALSVPDECQMLSEKWYGTTGMVGDAPVHAWFRWSRNNRPARCCELNASGRGAHNFWRVAYLPAVPGVRHELRAVAALIGCATYARSRNSASAARFLADASLTPLYSARQVDSAAMIWSIMSAMHAEVCHGTRRRVGRRKKYISQSASTKKLAQRQREHQRRRPRLM